MKKHVLFLATLLLSTLGAVAQTDVTSQYLVNPSFESSAEGSASTATALSKTGGTYYGWTLPNLGDSYANVSIGNSSTCDGQGFGTSAASDGNFYFFNRKGWSTQAGELSQTVNLPAGKYYVSFDYKAYERTSTNGTLGIKVNGNSIISTKPFYATNANSGTWAQNDPWKTLGAWFTVEADGEVTIAIAENLVGGSARADLYIDNIRLYQWSTDDAANQAAASPATPLDMTSMLVKNPYFDNNATDWTSTTGYQNSGRATNQGGAFSGGFWENWNTSAKTSGKMSQTATGVPSGKYRLTAAVFGNNATAETTGLYLFIGDQKTAITSGTPALYSVEAETTNGSLEFGLVLEDGNVCNWIGLDNVRLEMIQAINAIDLSTWNEAKAAAETALGLYDEKYAISQRQAVTDAMAGTPTSISEMDEMISALNEAVATYTKKADNEILVEENADLVYRYNTACQQYTILASTTWETPATSGQHWNGTDTKYFDTWSGTATAKTYTCKVTLPAGEYMLKAAGRGAASTKTFIQVGDVKEYFNNKGDMGYGIATDGEFTFDMSKTYANNGAGRGWEWRYIKFNLTEDTEMTLTCGYELVAGSWASICVPELYTNETSVKALRLQEISTLLTQVPSGDMNTEVQNNLNSKKTTAQNASASNTIEELETIKSELESAIAAANTSIQTYEAVNSALETYISKARDLDEAGQMAIYPTIMGIMDAYDMGEIEDGGTEVKDLRDAYIAAVKAQTSDNAVMTDALVNPSFEEGTTGWTNVRNTTGTYDYRTDGANPADGNLTLNAWADQVNYINVWQKVTLPIGTYTLTAKARTNAETLAGKTQVRTYVSGKETSHSNDLTYTATEDYAWNSQEAWQTLTTTFTITQETEVEMGIYSTGVNIMGDHRGWFQVDDFQLVRVSDAPKATVHAYVNGEAKYGTFCAPFDVKLDYYVKAYIAEKIENNSLVLDQLEGNNVPAHTPVIIYYGGTYTTDFTGYITEGTPQAGLLTGTYEKIAAPVGSYLLQNQNGVVGFYRVDSEGLTVGANRAYLTTPEGTNVKGFLLEQTDAIEAIQALTEGKAKIYDVNGRQLQSLQKGVNIVGGHKIMVK